MANIVKNLQGHHWQGEGVVAVCATPIPLNARGEVGMQAPPIIEGLDNLYTRLQRLAERVSVLEEKTGPILCPLPATKQPEMDCKPGCGGASQYAARISNLCIMVDNIEDQINDIHRRMEI